MANAKPRILSEWRLRWMLNLYPPLLFNRVRVREVGEGCRSCRVEVHRSLLTRNLNGTTFGGSIFAGADPFYALLYWQIFARLGSPVQSWLKSASIEYLKPARTTLTLRFALDDDDVRLAREGLERDGRFRRVHRTEAVDRDGEVCAVVETEVYLRLPRADQRQVSAF